MPASHQGRRGAGELESEVLGALWTAPAPLTPAQIQAALGNGLAYNTVHTILTRLQEKGLVERQRAGTRHLYAPTKDAAEHAADQMRTLLDRGPDRTAVLQRFVTSLNADDEAALRRMLGPEKPR